MNIDELSEWLVNGREEELPRVANSVAVLLAREVQAYRALRPACPSCHGQEWMIEPEGDDPGCHCQGCTDGKASIESMALLVAIGAKVMASGDWYVATPPEWRPAGELADAFGRGVDTTLALLRAVKP